jgi:hypothetical protein
MNGKIKILLESQKGNASPCPQRNGIPLINSKRPIY